VGATDAIGDFAAGVRAARDAAPAGPPVARLRGVCGAWMAAVLGASAAAARAGVTAEPLDVGRLLGVVESELGPAMDAACAALVAGAAAGPPGTLPIVHGSLVEAREALAAAADLARGDVIGAHLRGRTHAAAERRLRAALAALEPLAPMLDGPGGAPTQAPAAAPLLTPRQRLLWEVLAARVLIAKELASALGPGWTEQGVRKLISRVRLAGARIELRPGAGYYRPDAPPPG